VADLFKTARAVFDIVAGRGHEEERANMFAVDHALTALVLKRRYPSVSLALLLVSVQAMELAWVALNYAGIERTETDAQVASVANVHLVYMPFSHSLLTATVAAVLVGVVVGGLRGSLAGQAIGLGVVSHLVLDLFTHARDIALAPGSTTMLGSGLYAQGPIVAFAVELGFGLLCWWIYVRGRMRETAWRALLALAIVGNLLNLSFLSPAIQGPEQFLAGRPELVVTVVLLQIVTTLSLVYWLASRAGAREMRLDDRPQR